MSSPPSNTPLKSQSWQGRVNSDDNPIVKKGLIIVFGFLGVFLIWALFIPISSAVIATGQLVSVGKNKLLQHPTGGVVEQINAVDGQYLEKGDVIVVLDPSSAQAKLTRLNARHKVLTAKKARLMAEKSGSQTLDFSSPVSLFQSKLRGPIGMPVSYVPSPAGANSIADEQQSKFVFGRQRRNAEIEAADLKVEGLRAKRTGLALDLVNQKRLQQLTQMETEKVRPLVKQGYTAKSKLWELEKKLLDQSITISQTVTRLDSLDQQILESEAEIRKMTAGNKEKISEELTSIIGELGEISDQINASQIAVKLAKVRAPISGTLTKMAIHTVGGVVSAGTTLGEIVPTGTDLIAEVRVAPKDIFYVTKGQSAKVVVTAFNRRLYDPIEATVDYVSADSTTLPTGEIFFTARVKLGANINGKNGINLLKAGMQTNVFIQSAKRPFMSFMLQPVFDSLQRAFREP